MGIKQRVKMLFKNNPILRGAVKRFAVFFMRIYNQAFPGEVNLVWLDYPVDPKPRGANSPILHAMKAYEKNYEAHLNRILAQKDSLSKIPFGPVDDSGPFWDNSWFSGLDAAALYAWMAAEKPGLYLEIGSGHSTRFAARARTDHHLSTRIVSVDPMPRAEIDALCDEVVRTPCESLDPAFFDQLKSGDILFIDSSHRSFQNSDVTMLFLEVLPRLKKGVLVHVHDIFWPSDYPAEWAKRFYNEQYLLGAYLLAGYFEEILFSSAYVSFEPRLRRQEDPLWSGPLSGSPRGGSSIWLRTAAPRTVRDAAGA